MYTQDQKHFVSNGNWFKILIDIPEIHQAYNPFKVTSITTVSPIYKVFNGTKCENKISAFKENTTRFQNKNIFSEKRVGTCEL